MFGEGASRTQLLWFGGVALLLSAILIVGRPSRLEEYVSQSSQQQNSGADTGSGSRDQADQRVQQLQEQYGNVSCTNFENQQEAQDVFELDQIRVACDEGNYFSNREPADSLLQAGGPGSGPLQPCLMVPAPPSTQGM